MRVLLSRLAYDRFAALLQSAPIDCTWICLEEDGTLTTGERREPLQGADATVAWASTDVLYSQVPYFQFAADMSSLEWLQSSFAGLDVPVYPSLLKRGVVVTTSHGNAVSIAEYVLGAVLRVYQQPERWHLAQRQREWKHHEFPEIHGSTWLVVGLGAIGTEVARRAMSFGANVIGVRRVPDGTEPVDRVLRLAEIPGVISEADVVVLAVPAHKETRHLFDIDLLARLREGCVLVNVARGSLIKEPDLLRSLESGRPGVAILDVFETEPLPPESPLWGHPRVIITPHASSGGYGRHVRNAQLFLRNLDAWVSGRQLEHVLTMEQLNAAHVADDVPAQFKT